MNPREDHINAVERKLGMDIVRTAISDNCQFLPAQEMVTAMAFTDNYGDILQALEETSEMVSVIEGERQLHLMGLSDIRQWLVHLRAEGTYIDVDELGALRSVLAAMREVSDFFAVSDADDEADEQVVYPRLSELAAGITDVRELIRIIDKILTPTGIVKDNASPALSDIRSRMSTIQNRISSAIRKVLHRAVSEGIVDPDTQPAIRGGRLVLPVAAMNKRRLTGIVHDESSTGKTYFIEPAEVVELGNEQRELEIEERREIVRILTECASQIRPWLNDISDSFGILVKMDFIRAKALFAQKNGGELPKLVDKPLVQWHDARNAVLRMALSQRGRTVVPMDIDLTEDTARILVISGPNAGGKSVALKTVGLNQYMTQCGVLPVMDSNSRVGIFDKIFVDLGDDQSIEDDLSTYSSHLRNMKFVLSHGTDRSLFLIDEFGSGTEPQIGGAIAQALLAEFNAKGMWGVVTTHYQNLKQLAQETPGIINGSMVYDRQLMKPTFKLSVGNPGSSFAIEIAMRTGLPKSVIEETERIVGSDYFNIDKYLLDINRDRRYWENKRADIRRREKHLEEVIARYEQNAENLRQQRRTIIEDAKAQADSIIARSNAAVEHTIREIRQAQADKEATKTLRRKLEEERESIANDVVKENRELRRAPRPKKPRVPVPLGEDPAKKKIAVGDNVLLDNAGQPGQVLEIMRDKATVSFGVMKMTVPVERLTKTIRKATSKPSDGSSVLTKETTEASRQRQLAFKTEIDVRGMRADEAVQAVMYFIDDALQFNNSRVRILHGTGTGALRNVIRQYLSTVSGIRAYHDEDVRMGGAGITVVDL